MATPSKRSKKSARAAGASESAPPELAAEAVDVEEAGIEEAGIEEAGIEEAGIEEAGIEEAGIEDQEVIPSEPPEAEENEPAFPLDGSVEESTAAPITQSLLALPADDVLEGRAGKAEEEATIVARTPSRPRKTTLAMAITRPAPLAADSQTTRESGEPAEATEEREVGARRGVESAGSVVDEVDEWSIADQPTVYLSPQQLTVPPKPVRSRVEAPAPDREPEAPRRPPEVDQPPRERSANPPRWLASTDDDRWPATNHRPTTSPERVKAYPPSDEHMERFQRLREGRMAHQEGNRGPGENRQVADIVRQWWRDLHPGLTSALSYQREARASGVHPIPAHEPLPGSRLGDAFGRFAASAREMTGRAQSAMTPRLNRLQELHAQAESAASALVSKMEAPLSRQQAPLLGPGRIAVFFKPGVTVGQAQSLLGASRARPIRLIPRKHGFLALVPPGAEAEICERLREHPYIRDVAYVEYDEYGDPIRPPATPR